MKNRILILGFLIMVSPALAKDKPNEDIYVSMDQNSDGVHVLDGQFSLSTSTRVAWDVLTDYDHMTQFVSSIQSSHQVERKNDLEMIEQKMVGKAGLFHKRIYLLLEVKEKLFQKISFRDISNKSFKSYSGYWELEPLENQVKVKYHLEAQPDFFSPNFIAFRAFKNTVKVLLSEVRNEIISREEKGMVMNMAIKNSIQRFEINIDYPLKNEPVIPGHYAVRISSTPDTQVEVCINGGKWQVCRPSEGYYWFDWWAEPGNTKILARYKTEKNGWKTSKERQVKVVSSFMP